jgi:hypothetical protein
VTAIDGRLTVLYGSTGHRIIIYSRHDIAYIGKPNV